MSSSATPHGARPTGTVVGSPYQGKVTHYKIKAMVDQGGEVLNKQAHNNALWAKQNAQAEFKRAYDEGDADAMTKAQGMIAKATLAEQQSMNMARS